MSDIPNSQSSHATTPSKTSTKTSSVATDIKAALHGIHGAGETIRGTSMQALDGAFNERRGETKNAAIAEKGINEMERGRDATSRSGVQRDLERERAVQGRDVDGYGPGVAGAGVGSGVGGGVGHGSGTTGGYGTGGVGGRGLAHGAEPGTDQVGGLAGQHESGTGVGHDVAGGQESHFRRQAVPLEGQGQGQGQVQEQPGQGMMDQHGGRNEIDEMASDAARRF